MKLISRILIITYLALPALCFWQPCAAFSLNPPQQQSAFSADASAESPVGPDHDHCESTCCCAGSILPSAVTIPFAPLLAERTAEEPLLRLLRLAGRIFVPPQLLS